MRGWALVLVALLGGGPAAAQVPLLDRGGSVGEACYGRVYDGAHLSRNPNQSISEVYLARLNVRDSDLETEPPRPEDVLALVRERSTMSLPTSDMEVIARLRDPPGVFVGGVSCTHAADGTFACAVECDGGGFRARPDGAGVLVEFETSGLRVGPSCGGSERDSVRLGARRADRTVRMSTLPVASCYAARDAARPGWVGHGPPLRETLPGTGTACFTRAYDQGHMAQNPEQRIVSLATRARWNPGTADSSPSIDITLSARLRNGAVQKASARCFAVDYAFVCTAEGREGSVMLTRGPNSGVMIRSMRSDTDEAGPVQVGLSLLLGQSLGRGDDVFRLDRSATLAACPD